MHTIARFFLGFAVVSALRAQERHVPVEVAREGKAALWRVGEQRVLLLAGTPKEMGLQHGKLLASEVLLVLSEVLAWTARRGCDRACLAKILDAHAPHTPDAYAQEMEGLAEGSGASLELIRLVHAMPERFHCSGAAVRGPATRDGKLYHTRSLDYSLDIGVTSRLQNHALLIVRRPTDGVASAVPAWAGFLGAVTGLNTEGIGIGEMGSGSSDEDYAGLPMIFMVRVALDRARTLEEAVQVFRKGPRTCGYNFIVSSGEEKDAVALEVTRSRFAVFPMGSPKEDVAPHFAMPDAVRRVNHFVDKDLAATQRET
jgi:predicted choloylglycine hydrolase